MKINKLLILLTIPAAILFNGCNKNDTNPNVITLQTIAQASVPLSSTSGFAILAGSGITSTGATNVTGDVGLSPGSSISGFPPGILNGTQHINDITASTAKLDLTAAYNNAVSYTHLTLPTKRIV